MFWHVANVGKWFSSQMKHHLSNKTFMHNCIPLYLHFYTYKVDPHLSRLLISAYLDWVPVNSSILLEVLILLE